MTHLSMHDFLKKQKEILYQAIDEKHDTKFIPLQENSILHDAKFKFASANWQFNDTKNNFASLH